MTYSNDQPPREIVSGFPVVAVSTAGLTFSVGTVLFYTFGVFVRPLEAEFGWGRAALSGAILALQLSMAVAAPLYGFLIDRFGARRIILLSITPLCLLVAALSLLDHAIWQLYLVFALVPLLAGGASPIGYARVLVTRFERDRGLALGMALAGVGIGATLLPPLAQGLISSCGWRVAYLVLGMATFLATFPACLMFLPNQHIAASHRFATPVSCNAWTIMRSPTYLQITCLFIAIGAVTVAAVPHMVPIVRSHGLSDGASAGVAATIGIAVILGRGLVGSALDHMEAAKVLMGILGLLALAMALLAFAHQIGMLMAAAFLTGFAVGAEVDILAFLVSRYFPEHLFSRLYGTALGVFMASSGVGPFLLGASFAKTGDYRQGLIIMSAVALIASGLSSRLPSSRTAAPVTAHGP